jgi:VIT1/CCC1 family predicted Fe2+/Mn2+ transporter
MIKSKRIINPRLRAIAMEMEQEEINEYGVYAALAAEISDPHNAQVLQKMAALEREHAEFWAERTGVMLEAQEGRVRVMVMAAKVLGLMFVLKTMERTMGVAEERYKLLAAKVPEVVKISADQTKHEMELLEILDEERLQFMGSIVLGLNDALVELMGVLAGFTLSLSDTKMVSLAGLITGISAAMSMGAAEYMSRRADNDKNALKAGLYTFITYIVTVIVLILPFLLIKVGFLALLWTVILAVVIMAAFNFYLAVVRNTKFLPRFREMALLSLTIAAISFIIGFILEKVFF